MDEIRVVSWWRLFVSPRFSGGVTGREMILSTGGAPVREIYDALHRAWPLRRHVTRADCGHVVLVFFANQIGIGIGILHMFSAKLLLDFVFPLGDLRMLFVLICINGVLLCSSHVSRIVTREATWLVKKRVV